jgi:hypothetical protein
MKYKINKPSKKVENTTQEINKNRNVRSKKLLKNTNKNGILL